MTLAELEAALDSGTLYAQFTNGKSYRVRRNGRTQRWKTRPDDYRIPVKARLKDYDAITPANASFYEVKP